MRRRRFSVEQIGAVLKQAELRLPIAGLIRMVGISEQTFYRSKKKYAGPELQQAREFKQLAEENGWPKRLAAKLSLDKAVLQDVLAKNSPASVHKRRWRLCDGVSRLQRAAVLRTCTPEYCNAMQAERA
jgi:putative transposase